MSGPRVRPSLWKTGRVVPIFKTGDKNVASDYRPISVLSMLSKIFEIDCVNHDIPLGKLESFDVKGLSLQITASFLRCRCQFVPFNGTLSATLQVKVGDSQGLVLAPTFFQIFIYDILRLPIISSLFLYAVTATPILWRNYAIMIP